MLRDLFADLPASAAPRDLFAAAQEPNALIGTLNAAARGASFGANDAQRALSAAGLPPGNPDDMSPEQQGDYYAALARIKTDPSALAGGKQQVKKENETFQDEHPLLSTGAELAGAVASPIGGAITHGTGALVNAATRASPVVAQSVAQGVGKYLAPGVQGTAQGAAYGAGTPDDTVGGAEKGAALGFLGGTAVPVVADAAKGAWGFVTKPFTSRSTAGASIIGDSADALSGAAQVGMDKLKQRMLDIGWTPQRIEAKMQQLGPNAVLADLEPFAGLQEAVAQVPGMPSATAARVLGIRDKQAGTRMLDAVKENLTAENFHGNIDALNLARSSAAQPLRTRAINEMDSHPITSDAVQRLMTRPAVQQGIRDGISLVKDQMAVTGEEIPTHDVWFSGQSFDDPNIITKTTPTLRVLDAAKQGLDAMLEKYRDPYSGKLNLDPAGVSINNMRAKLVAELRAASPTYAEYLDAWAGPSQVKDAMARGRSVLNNDPEITSKLIKGMSDSEKQGYQIGLARALQDKITDNPQSALRYFDKGSIEAKMRAGFPSSEAYNAFKQSALSEARMHQTFAQARTNSPSVRRALGVADLTEPDSGMVDKAHTAINIATMNKPGLVRQGVNWATRPTQAVANELAPAIFSKDPAIQARVLSRLRASSGLNLPPPENPTGPTVGGILGGMLGR